MIVKDIRLVAARLRGTKHLLRIRQAIIDHLNQHEPYGLRLPQGLMVLDYRRLLGHNAIVLHFAGLA